MNSSNSHRIKKKTTHTTAVIVTSKTTLYWDLGLPIFHMDFFPCASSIRIENEENDEDNQQLDLETMCSLPFCWAQEIWFPFSVFAKLAVRCKHLEFSLRCVQSNFSSKSLECICLCHCLHRRMKKNSSALTLWYWSWSIQLSHWRHKWQTELVFYLSFMPRRSLTMATTMGLEKSSCNKCTFCSQSE